VVQARNANGDVGFVPENYIRIWNPVDDAGDSDANEVNVDDDTSGIASMHMAVDGNGCIDYPSGLIETDVALHVCVCVRACVRVSQMTQIF
jgi:hypothetical protein